MEQKKTFWEEFKEQERRAKERREALEREFHQVWVAEWRQACAAADRNRKTDE